MKYRKLNDLDIEVSLLGLGTLRFPTHPSGELDYDRSVKLIRRAIDKGVNYLDLGVNYFNGESEKVVGIALKDGYRDKVIVTDKILVRLLNKPEDVENTFESQLQKLGIDYFDFYFIHNVNRASWKTVKEYKILEFLEKKKKEGVVKHIGFSYHDDVAFFKEIVDAYPWEMCQIQLNYMDTEFQAGVEGLKYAAERGMNISIMEPLKGGCLARKAPDSVQKIWDDSGENMTRAEWAYRWVADFPEVSTVLSSFASEDLLDEAIAVFSNIEPESLTQKQHETIKTVADEFRSKIKYPCTECRYCMPCPMDIDIPHLIRLYNELYMYEDTEKVDWEYGLWFRNKQNQFDCVKCGKCEKSCPQGLKIMDIMEKSKAELA